jgi:hypothetical protein
MGLTTSQMRQAYYYQAYNWGGTIWTIDQGNDYPHLAWENKPGTFITSPVVPFAGSGTAESPWIIQSKDDFLVVCGGSYFWDKHYVLNNDIDLGAAYTHDLIGYDESNPFTGSFDGGAHTISNITIQGANNYLGFFGYIGSGGYVSNLGLKDVNIIGTGDYIGGLAGWATDANVSNCFATGAVSGNGRVGGLVGYVGGSASVTDCHAAVAVAGSGYCVGGLIGEIADSVIVTDCYASGSVNGYSIAGGLVGYAYYYTDITNCHATGVVNGTMTLGGLVGQSLSNTNNCYATGAVTATGSWVGGLIGGAGYGNVSNCYAIGNVTGDSYIGGLAGTSWATITNCRANGAVTAVGSYVGGLAGQTSYSEGRGSIANSYAAGAVAAGGDCVGGLVGYAYSGNITKCYAVGAIRGRSYVGGFMGYKDTGGTLTACFWDTQTSGKTDGVANINPDPAGTMGRTTGQMRTKSTFTNYGWDFNDVWHICETMNYPRLRWAIPAADFVCPEGVDFVDYSFFAAQWMNTNCAASNNCDGTDLDSSGTVDLADLKVFCSYWLSGL